MKKCLKIAQVSFLVAIFSLNASAQNTQNIWAENIVVPINGRTNILNLDPLTQDQYIKNGRLHAEIYPVDVTAALPPLNPMLNFFENKSSSLFQMILRIIGRSFTHYNSMDDIFKYLGLHPYPEKNDIGVYAVPYPNNIRPDYRLGYGVIQRHGVDGFTFSCATCHSSNLFGKTVLGLNNRFPRANEFFVKMSDLGPKVKPLIGTWLMNEASGATPEENQMFTDTLTAMDRVTAKMPITLGLDTTLAQISLSLNKRSSDPFATPNILKQLFPSADPFFDSHPADSKPGTWWLTKYKNRWLSDGSIVSGNPIITNLLWNEIGRGTDLQVLSTWISQNKKKIDELTAAVFSSEAPRITDFFNESQINIQSAKRGEIIFSQSCSKCHGSYEKAWSETGSETKSITEQIKTTKVNYPQKTFVVNVGTDPNRYLGMKSLEKLNDLQIAKDYGIRHVAQTGYVPPPLVGIWARWPYFHNNSAPNLCAVLTASASRPKSYYAGEPNDKNTDYDFECGGYPLNEKTPAAWKTPTYFYDTTKEGLHNTGHDERIFLENGVEKFSANDKKDLIHYLLTL